MVPPFPAALGGKDSAEFCNSAVWKQIRRRETTPTAELQSLSSEKQPRLGRLRRIPLTH